MTYSNIFQFSMDSSFKKERKTLNTESIALIIAIAIIIAFCIYFGYAFYSILEIIFHHKQVKKLCLALSKIVTSYSERQNFDNTIAEVEYVIQTIVKNDKKFPQSCRVPSGLLKQYIYWLNTNVATTLDSKICTLLKESSHTLIDLCNTTPYLSEATLYNEPLLNTLSQQLAKREIENANKSMSDLDSMIDKERKKASFIRDWLPPITAILSAIITVILTALL